jgi:hypothetical protein
LVKKESFLRLVLAFAAGAFSFWLPVIFARLVFGELGILLTVTLLTLVLPALLCLALDFLAQWWTMPRPKLVLAMITGIWLTGPFFMMLSLTFTRGEGFHAPGAWSFFGVGNCAVPGLHVHDGHLRGLAPCGLTDDTSVDSFRFHKLELRPVQTRLIAICRLRAAC